MLYREIWTYLVLFMDKLAYFMSCRKIWEFLVLLMEIWTCLVLFGEISGGFAWSVERDLGVFGVI